MVEVSLAELLLEHGDEERTVEALLLLDAALERNRGRMFNDQLFRWHLALLTASEQLGDLVAQQTSARTALDLASQGPQLPRHPTVGVVHTDEVTLAWLRHLADP